MTAKSSPLFQSGEDTNIYNARPSRCSLCPTLKQSAFALVLATVLALGAALAAYFGFGVVLKWAATAGAGTLALSTTLLFTAMSCANRRSLAPLPQTRLPASDKKLSARSLNPLYQNQAVQKPGSSASNSTKGKEKDVETRKDKRVPQQPQKVLQKPEPWIAPKFDGDEREDPKYWGTATLSDQMPGMGELAHLKEELKLNNFKQRLSLLYGKRAPQYLYLKDTTEQSKRQPLYLAQQKLFFMAVQDFLKLSLDEIDRFSSVEMHAVFERLRHLDPTHFEKRAFSEKENENSLTLGELLQMDLGDFCNFSDKIPLSCYALVPPRLFPAFMQQLESEVEIDWCFPTQFPAQRAWTKEKLALCNPEDLASRMNLFSPAQLVLMPTELFFTEKFPWNKLNRTLHYLRMLPMDVLNHPLFPWGQFVHFKDFGKFVREKTTQKTEALQLQYLPWRELLCIESTVEDIFVIEEYQYIQYEKRGVLEGIFLQLTPTQIAQIVDRLSAAHLGFIPNEKLLDKDFPWSEFFKKENIGSVLITVLDKEILGLSHLPLDDLPDTEVLHLFSGKERQYLLGILNLDQIKIFTKHLQLGDLVYLNQTHLSQEGFPWLTFCAMHGIGKQLRTLAIEEKNAERKKLEKRDSRFRLSAKEKEPEEKKTPSILTYVDWVTLSENGTELEDFFKIGTYDTEIDELWKLRSLFEPLSMSFLISIADRLSVTHLRFLAPTTLQQINFPWAKFLSKPGFGSEIRYWMYLNQFNLYELESIAWTEWSKLKNEELNALLDLNNRDNYGYTKLEPHQVIIFEKYFGLQHLSDFTEVQLNDSQFPWTHFFTLKGVGKVIRELVIEKKLSLQYVPLSKMPQKERSELLRYEGYADERMSLLVQSIADEDLQILHQNKQLVSHFHRLMRPEQRELLGLPQTD